MSRLSHTFKAYRRLMQMSRKQVFIFVEGKTDQYFYGEVSQFVCGQMGVPYELSSANILTGASGSGGKTVLDAFFVFLRRQSSLADDFQGKRTVALFFLDKDIDNLFSRQRRSQHIVYTKYYTVENHIYRDGDLVRAASATASIPIQVLDQGFGDPALWRQQVAETWKDWVKLCVFAKKWHIGTCNYGSPSQVNTAVTGLVDITLLNQFKGLLQANSSLSAASFALEYGKVSDKVDRLYSTGQYDEIFSGKWYLQFLEERVKAVVGQRPYNKEVLHKGLLSAMLITLDFQEGWADHFKLPLRSILDLV